MNLNYKLSNPFDSKSRLFFSLKSDDDANDKLGRNAFENIRYVMTLNNQLAESNKSFCEHNKNAYRDSLFQIFNLLYMKKLPDHYQPFIDHNLFYHLVNTFVELGNDDDIIENATKLLFCLSLNLDCCQFLVSINFFQAIESLITEEISPRMIRLKGVNQKYTYILIGALSNFAAYEKFHEFFSPYIIEYVSNAICSSQELTDYFYPMGFFENYTKYPIQNKSLMNQDEKNNNEYRIWLNRILIPIMDAIGWFAANPGLFQLYQGKSDDKLKEIHKSVSIILCHLTQNHCLPLNLFFTKYDNKILAFVSSFCYYYPHLMLMVGLFAQNYPNHFEKLNISIDNTIKCLDNDNDFLKITCFSLVRIFQIYPDIISTHLLIPETLNKLFNKFEENDFETKYYIFLVLCKITSFLNFDIIKIINDKIITILEGIQDFFNNNNFEAMDIFIETLKHIKEIILDNQNDISDQIHESFNNCVNSILTNNNIANNYPFLTPIE